MKQRIVHGAMVDMLTPDEFVKLIPRPAEKTRIRNPGIVVIDGSGNGKGDIYKVPIGCEFEVRRVVLILGGGDPNTNNILLNAAGKYVLYLRSGQIIEYANPQYGQGYQVPGVQTWGDEQGPYLRNGEVFGVQVFGFGAVAGTNMNVYLEGILTRPGASDNA